MSKTANNSDSSDQLTEEERETFEYLRENADYEEVQELCEIVLQSDKEATNS